ncbi:ClpP/crotonase-like domain-containing protein [Halteromyces radiatus]|uniref:ClpP/crotonase-like domain-containing protein n=1 Tax=Halteromyces radiatus TaxID=101107 RepID=UPI00221FB6E5|nr:ClpP/crotonase-like domain-containing protein [Halteromyces radiatus]KAI8092747.1 ClpP/crotonase-like domain-containing protein [Halteromyces radiatus]
MRLLFHHHFGSRLCCQYNNAYSFVYQLKRRIHINPFTPNQLPEQEIDVPKTHVLHRKLSGARMFILNRPEKLNALNLAMIRNIAPQLKAWDVSKLAKVILMKGANEGKFSVGDDVLDIIHKVNTKDPDALYYFQEKSSLIQMISTLSTPYVSILDGYALGGALGLFAHSPFRIATEKTIFSMPEPTMGVIFNAGSSFFLPKLDGDIGTYLALTGTRVEGLDAFYAGIATHYVPSSRLLALEDRLIDLETSEHEIIQRVLETFAEPYPTKRIGFSQSIRESIDRCFRHDRMEDIIKALDEEKQTSWTRETRHKLLAMSPTSLRVTLKALRKSKNMSLIECLKMEFDLMQKFLVTKDFHEGVDASLLNKPRRKSEWMPPTLKDISDDDIEQLYFTKPSPNALKLPSNMDLINYPYTRFSLPTEEDVRLAITGDGPEFGLEGRLLTAQDVLQWFEKGHRRKAGVKEKIMDILERKTTTVNDSNNNPILQWKSYY